VPLHMCCRNKLLALCKKTKRLQSMRTSCTGPVSDMRLETTTANESLVQAAAPAAVNSYCTPHQAAITMKLLIRCDLCLLRTKQ
jgi:hypothetical protein